MKYLTPVEVGDIVQLTPKTVCQWAREDASMPVTRFGRAVRFEQEALHRWLRAHGRRKSGAQPAQVPVHAAESA